jgi:glycosyltransferase involved in cell wall biosynthesis
MFSVPSKVLSYQCAARPILASIPTYNLAAKTVARSGSGLVVDSADESGFVAAAQKLVDSVSLRQQLGGNGRTYALKAFEIEAITDRFLRVLTETGSSPRP